MKNKKRMRYIVPFSFRNEESCIDKIHSRTDKNGNCWVHTTVKAGEQDLYKYVLDSFAELDGEQNNTYVASPFLYQVKENSKEPIKKFGYYRKNNVGKMKEFVHIADFDIKDMGLFLFRNEIGFLWYEISDFYNYKNEMTIEELYQFQFEFKELNRCRYSYLFREQGHEEEQFLMGNWIAEMIAELGLDATYFAERENELYLNGKSDDLSEGIQKKVPDKAVLFSFFAFEHEEKKQMPELSVPAYYLTKGYKTSYAYSEDAKKDMIFPFQNVCFYATQEGVGYYAAYNKSNKIFFCENMYEKVMNDYFLMYILLLYQKYAIVYFREEIGRNLSAVSTDYSERAICSKKEEQHFFENENRLDEMVTKLMVFLTKNMHTSVSYIQHQNEFYSYVSERLEIQKEIDNLSQGINTLQTILRDKRIRYEAERDGERDRKISSLLSFVSIIAFISTLFSLEDFIREFCLGTATDGKTMLLLSHPAYRLALYGFGMIFAIVVILFVISGVKKRRMSKRRYGKDARKIKKRKEGKK